MKPVNKPPPRLPAADTVWPVLCAATGGLDSAHDAGLRDVGPAGRCRLLVLLWIWRLPLPKDVTTTDYALFLVVRFRAAGWPDGRGPHGGIDGRVEEAGSSASGRCPALASPVPVTDWPGRDRLDDPAGAGRRL